jgi:hypothetical protein
MGPRGAVRARRHSLGGTPSAVRPPSAPPQLAGSEGARTGAEREREWRGNREEAAITSDLRLRVMEEKKKKKKKKKKNEVFAASGRRSLVCWSEATRHTQPRRLRQRSPRHQHAPPCPAWTAPRGWAPRAGLWPRARPPRARPARAPSSPKFGAPMGLQAPTGRPAGRPVPPLSSPHISPRTRRLHASRAAPSQLRRHDAARLVRHLVDAEHRRDGGGHKDVQPRGARDHEHGGARPLERGRDRAQRSVGGAEED